MGEYYVISDGHIASYAKKILHKIAIIFILICLNICFGFSKEPSH